MVYADLKSILKPVGKQYREKMNKKKTEQKGRTPYTETMNTHVPSGCCVHNTFACGDDSDPLKMCRGKDYTERFIEDVVRRLCVTFPQYLKTILTDVLKR